MKIVLIRVNERSDPGAPIEEANVTGIYPPLGLAYLAANLRTHGYNVRILDAHALNLNVNMIARNIKTHRDDVAGVTSTSLNWLRCLRLIAAIKEHCPTTKIIAGGPHMSLFAEEVAALPNIDVAIIGEGEYSIIELMNRFSRNEEPIGIPGVVFRSRDGRIVADSPPNPIADLDALPLPAIDLLPLTEYRALTIRKPFFTMVTSRGCPYLCGFCSQIYAGGAFRQRGSESVVEEMERYVKQYRAQEIILFDETFTIGELRVLRICELIQRKGIHVRWNIRARADTVSSAMVRALRAAGCYGIHIGVESGNPDILRRMKKEITKEQVVEAFRICQEEGMETRGYFMIGYPGETRATIEQTVSFSLALRLDWASYSITVPQPATKIFDDAVRLGLAPADYWTRYTRGDPPGPLPYFITDEYTAEDLERMARKAYLRFYFRFSQLVTKLGSKRLLLNLRDLIQTLWYLRSRRSIPEQDQ